MTEKLHHQFLITFFTLSLLTTLHKWIRASSRHRGIPFEEFELVMAKIWHAFTVLPAAIGLLSRTNSMLRKRPEWLYLHNKEVLVQEIIPVQNFVAGNNTRTNEMQGANLITSGFSRYMRCICSWGRRSHSRRTRELQTACVSPTMAVWHLKWHKVYRAKT